MKWDQFRQVEHGISTVYVLALTTVPDSQLFGSVVRALGFYLYNPDSILMQPQCRNIFTWALSFLRLNNVLNNKKIAIFWLICLLEFVLYIPVNKFSVMLGWVFLG